MPPPHNARLVQLADEAKQALHGIPLSDEATAWDALRMFMRRSVSIIFSAEHEEEAFQQLHTHFQHARRVHPSDATVEVLDFHRLLNRLLPLGRVFKAAGKQPSSNTRNTLLVRSQLGRSKRSTQDLPPADFVYGHPPPRPVVGSNTVKEVMDWGPQFGEPPATAAAAAAAAAAIGTTGTMSPSSFAGSSASISSPSGAASASSPAGAAKDYKALNRMLVKEGMLSTAEANRFIMENDVRVRLPENRLKKPSRPVSATHAYGMAVAPSQPVASLVGGEHQFDWLLEKQAANALETGGAPSIATATAASVIAAQTSPSRRYHPADTKANMLRALVNRSHTDQKQREAAELEPAPFKMRRFANVPSKIAAHRGNAAVSSSSSPSSSGAQAAAAAAAGVAENKSPPPIGSAAAVGGAASSSPSSSSSPALMLSPSAGRRSLSLPPGARRNSPQSGGSGQQQRDAVPLLRMNVGGHAGPGRPSAMVH